MLLVTLQKELPSTRYMQNRSASRYLLILACCSTFCHSRLTFCGTHATTSFASRYAASSSSTVNWSTFSRPPSLWTESFSFRGMRALSDTNFNGATFNFIHPSLCAVLFRTAFSFLSHTHFRCLSSFRRSRPHRNDLLAIFASIVNIIQTKQLKQYAHRQWMQPAVILANEQLMDSDKNQISIDPPA